MIKLNSITLNGKSSADFPFFVAVEQIPGIVRSNKKDKIFKQDYVNGAVKQTIEAYDLIELEFVFYLFNVTRQQVREFKKWFVDSGQIRLSTDPTYHYNYLGVGLETAVMDETGGYQVKATFTCEPFEYEAERTITLGSTLINHTSVPMYPLITVEGNTTSETFLTIGSQTMYFKQGIDTRVTIECKHGLQNVRDKSNRLINNQVRGPFFEIAVGNSSVKRGTGITRVTMLTRWGWR